MVRTSVTHWAAPRVPLLSSNHILTPSVEILSQGMVSWNLFVDWLHLIFFF